MADLDWHHHCADEAADAFRAKHGRSAWRLLRSRSPRSSRAYAALLRKHGVRSMSGLVTKVLGDPIRPALAQRGDIVRRGSALGRCIGDHALFAQGGAVAIRDVDEVWRL